MERAADEQARTLLGADLALVGRRPFSAPVEALIDSIGGTQSRQIDFSSMVHFPKSNGTRLARVRTLEGAFPYYGEFETVPRRAATAFRNGQNALVDESLMLQFGAQVGDSVKVGMLKFRIAGNLKKAPGEVAAIGLVAPRVYLPLHYLPLTGLVQRGSQVTYRVFFKLNEGIDPGQLARKIQPQLNTYRVSSETAAQRRDRTGRTLANLYYFLNLAGFMALVLGSMGIASSIHTYVKQKLSTVAILRCLGSRARESTAVYLVQTAVMGLVGSGSGALLGIGVLFLLPDVLGDFLPLEIGLEPSGLSIVQGIAIGLGMSVLFALLPLLALRRVSPLRALRSSLRGKRASRAKGPSALAGLPCPRRRCSSARPAPDQELDSRAELCRLHSCLLFSCWLSWAGDHSPRNAKRFLPSSLSYVWRQGLANLHRPNNQTVMLIVVLGLVTFLISTFYLAQHLPPRSASPFVSGGDQPNLVLFDIQPDQTRQSVADLLDDFGLPLMQQVPIVTMRLEAVNGRRVEEIRNDSILHRYPGGHCAGSTVPPTETGWWIPRLSWGESGGAVSPGPRIRFLYRWRKGWRCDLQVGVGDELVFDVQGLPIPVVIGSLRKVEWQRISPNFLVLFPAGVLEKAPAVLRAGHAQQFRGGGRRSAAGSCRAPSQRFDHRLEAHSRYGERGPGWCIPDHPLYGLVQSGDRIDRFGSRDRQRPLPAPPGKRAAANIRRDAAPDQANNAGGIPPPRRIRRRSGPDPRPGRQLGPVPLRVRCPFCSSPIASAGPAGFGHGLDRPGRHLGQRKYLPPAPSGSTARRGIGFRDHQAVLPQPSREVSAPSRRCPRRFCGRQGWDECRRAD